MAKYAKVEAGKVVQINLRDTAGFVSCGDEVTVGYDYDGTNFTAPAPAAPTWGEVRNFQRELIVKHQDLIEIYEREVAHTNTNPPYSNGMDEAKYQEWLDYFQTIRASDEATYPNDPQAAWNNLLVLEQVSSQPVTVGYNA